MKQMTLAEFVQLPPGTVFSFWEPCIATGLHVKGNTIEQVAFNSDTANDFFYLPLLPEPDSLQDYGGPGFPPPCLPALLHRWGMYDHAQLFAVYEPNDVRDLIAALSGADPT